MVMMFAAHRLSRWLEWVTKDGEVIQFKMPSRAHEELSHRLARLVNDRDTVKGDRVTPAEAKAAMQVAITLVLCHGSDMREFYFCRRAMSREGERVAANLGLSEWMIRRAREILEAVGFIERCASFAKWATWSGNPDDYDKRKAKRRPTKFEFGSYFVAWLSYASRKVRFRSKGVVSTDTLSEPSSLIQEGISSDSNSAPATPSTGRTGHLGEGDGGTWLTRKLKARWRRDPNHRPAQFPIPNLC